jgi:hypothetical protein
LFPLLASYEGLKVGNSSIKSVSSNFQGIVKRNFNDPDYTIQLSNGERLQILVVVDARGTENFFCDYNKCDRKQVEKVSDFIAYYFVKRYEFYLIPTSKLFAWLEANKKDYAKHHYYPYSNVNGYTVKVDVLTKGILDIAMYRMN